MLKKELVSNDVYLELQPLVKTLGLDIVSVSRHIQHGSSSVFLVIKAQDRPTTVDDCARVHRLVEARLELLWNDRDLTLEVSTPGVQRNFADMHEFSLFIGNRVRIYDTAVADWISGIIDSVETDAIALSHIVADGAQEIPDQQLIPFERIHKAKLDYIWEEGPHGQ